MTRFPHVGIGLPILGPHAGPAAIEALAAAADRLGFRSISLPERILLPAGPDWRNDFGLPDAPSYEARFTPYTPPADTDLSFKVAQLRSNSVIRWEYRPGSTLSFVWQQGRLQEALNRGTFEFERDYRDLFRAHPLNTFLIKATYFWNP